MRFVKPAVFLIAKTLPKDSEILTWLKHVGCSDEVAKHYAFADVAKKPAERVIELAGRRCYLSFTPGLNPNVTKIREDIAEYLNNVMDSGHGSVLEHVTFTFAIEGVSRVFTGEMNRHRAGVAISEGSMRYIKYNDIPMVETPMLEANEEDGHALQVKKVLTKQLFKRMFEQDEEGYKEFCEIWKDELAPESTFTWKKHLTSLGRRFIGMGVATGGIWTFNVRALRHMVTMRCSEAAEEEIAVVAGLILERMMKVEPILFGDFFKNDKGYWTPKYEKV